MSVYDVSSDPGVSALKALSFMKGGKHLRKPESMWVMLNIRSLCRGGSAVISRQALAKKCGVSRWLLKNTLVALKQAGVISFKSEYAGDARQVLGTRFEMLMEVEQ